MIKKYYFSLFLKVSNLIWSRFFISIASAFILSVSNSVLMANEKDLTTINYNSNNTNTTVTSATTVNSKNYEKANHQFSLNLYNELSKTEGNLFFSALSIQVALSMTSAGAEKETLRQMLNTLQIKSVDHSIFKNTMKQLKGNEHFQLEMANRLWGQSGENYKVEFLKILRDFYNAGLEPLDFKLQAEASRKTINQWVEKQTANKIQELLPAGAIDQNTILVLTNAVYFKSNWQQEFEKSLTRNEDFHFSKKTKSIPFMHMTSYLNYAENSDCQFLQLPYKGNEMVMEILLPSEKLSISNLEKKLNPQLISELSTNAKIIKVNVSLPKFKTESSFELNSTLSKMGMPLAFDPGKANFQGMKKINSNENIYISKAIHKAFVDIDEAGTEAAAATAVVMTLDAAMPQQHEPIKVFKANRPFLFFIRHLKSGSLVFMGRYSVPH